MRTLRLPQLARWPSHPSKHPSPPDEARRLQPRAELRVTAVLTQVSRHLCRGTHRGVDGGVALQCAVHCLELLAELPQRVAAAELDDFAPRVPPQGSQQRVRHGLRRQTRQVVQALFLHQAVQRVRDFLRNLRVLASSLARSTRDSLSSNRF